MYKLKDIIASGGGNNKINKFINKYVLSKKEKKEIIKEIKENKGGSGGSCEEKEWLYYKLNRETNKDMFLSMNNFLYNLYLAVYDKGIVTETISYYSQYPYDDSDYAGYIRLPKQDFINVSWTDSKTFNQGIADKKYFKQIMLMLFPDIEEITKEEYYSIVTIPIEQYPRTEMPTQ